VRRYAIGIPPDLGNDYYRELERKQLEEAHQRQGRTHVPSKLWLRRRLGIDPRLFLPNMRLGIGQKLLLLGLGLIVVLVLFIMAAALTPPAPN
jgi:hypothetical protein